VAQSPDQAVEPTSRNYFVDEAGDGVLFDRKGRVIIGQEGCSRFFMLGVLDVPDPSRLTEALAALRKALLSDPYFRGVPSMQPQAGKTAAAFHATDDLPEVRREVFRVLQQTDVRFQAVVKHKEAVLDYVLSRNAASREYRYHPNELYDLMIRRLFKPLLHKHTLYGAATALRKAGGAVPCEHLGAVQSGGGHG